jgi:hypothetical protein
MVRPSAERSRWSTRAPPSSPSEAAAMVWEPDARAYSQLMVTGEGDSGMGSARLEQTFQRLLVLRWRREADAMPRCLGLSLEGSAEHPDGRPLLLAVRECARRAVRTLVVDRTWGAEAIDALPAGDELRVTYADFHREQGWRVTVVAHLLPSNSLPFTGRWHRLAAKCRHVCGKKYCRNWPAKELSSGGPKNSQKPTEIV